MDIDDIVVTLRSLKQVVRDEFDIELVGIFGSMAKGNYSEKSDVDVLVKGGPSADQEEFNAAELFLSSQVHRAVSLRCFYMLRKNFFKDEIAHCLIRL